MMSGAGIFRTQLPKGFSAGGVNCGVRRYRPDLGIIISDTPCIATGVFTQNLCKAAPVKYCENLLPANNIRAIITNSGEANAVTGKQGVINNQKIADSVAEKLQCQSNQVLVASTGVIAQQLSIDKITAAVPELLRSLSKLAENFAVSILTTDLVPKTVHKTLVLSTGTVTITGICKGSGMIHPNMATMLGYLLTDAKLTPDQSQQFLSKANDKSFNMISVDGDTSTNDCVFMLSNGVSGVELANQQDIDLFYDALEAISITLAKGIARDGEGASKLIEVSVKGLQQQKLAKQIARAITTSPLVKTAIYGESPNWGRVLAKAGCEAVTEAMLDNCKISMQDSLLFEKGSPLSNPSELSELEQKMKEDTIVISIDFCDGPCSATAWGCDLTEKYVKINAEYLS